VIHKPKYPEMFRFAQHDSVRQDETTKSRLLLAAPLFVFE
jgi:hypothetical protein